MSDCLLEMLNSCLKRINPPLTQEALAKALESPPLAERILAQQLRGKYCQGKEEKITHISATSGPSPPGHLPATQGNYLNVFQYCGNLVSQTCRLLVKYTQSTCIKFQSAVQQRPGEFSSYLKHASIYIGHSCLYLSLYTIAKVLQLSFSLVCQNVPNLQQLYIKF